MNIDWKLISQILSWLSAMSAFASAILWWRSAAVPIKIPNTAFEGMVVGAGAARAAFKKAAILNMWAAGTTGLAVCFQAVAGLIAPSG
jgi:hypothetical protein